MSRRPSPPPDLPGFTYVEPLGTGGFADVFLYEQEMPRRRVAVKVLLADRISSSAAQEFADEANVMAMLSTHPAIVTIYQAGVAGDGRPYLVMEYCPRPNLQIRSRKEPFSVAEALRVGIQVAGAVETAHRAGVLHRDIKPANILVTEYNRPALTDFGIASTTGATGEASGMSIPWSPPEESFAEPPQSGPRTDVWALGATLYTLLAGRSPFERQGERNSSADLIERIERAALPSLKRPDSPRACSACSNGRWRRTPTIASRAPWPSRALCRRCRSSSRTRSRRSTSSTIIHRQKTWRTTATVSPGCGRSSASTLMWHPSPGRRRRRSGRRRQRRSRECRASMRRCPTSRPSSRRSCGHQRPCRRPSFRRVPTIGRSRARRWSSHPMRRRRRSRPPEPPRHRSPRASRAAAGACGSRSPRQRSCWWSAGSSG
ncbi:serine/threonine-protein kinase [Microbacterium sp. Se63.02b]|uniref:serine/threonine-protein kinase n=1 Tax=Microbacterium sp. Se63.02b TaxID=2709304 RepID=UPI0031F71BBF